MSLKTSWIKGVVTDFMSATPSATVTFQAVSAPRFMENLIFLWEGVYLRLDASCDLTFWKQFLATAA